MDEATMKTCKTCEVPKPATTAYFHKHNATRDRLDQRCKECQSKAKKKVYQDNTGEFNQRTTAWRATNPDKARAIGRRANAKRRKKPMTPAVRAAVERYRTSDKGRRKHAKVQMEREARKRNQFVEQVDRELVWDRDGGYCGICGDPVELEDMHLDHVIPIARGGMHSYDNVQASHPLCNIKKGARILESERV